MPRVAKQKREFLAEQEAHEQTRQERDEAYKAAQYLRLKVESLWNLIAQCTQGGLAAMPLEGYSPDFEALENAVLQRALERSFELEEAHTEPDFAREPSEAPQPKRQKLSGRKPNASNPVPDSSPATFDAETLLSSDGPVHPADPLFSTSLSSDTTLPSDPWSDAIDPVILAQQTEAAREILGELCECPVAQRILPKAGELTKDELQRMKAVLELSMDARMDVCVFAEVLFGD